MKSWKTKVFGDNLFNFYGWLFAGLVVMGGSFYFLKRGMEGCPTSYLIAIYMLLLGCFGVLLTNYLARVAEKLDGQRKAKTEEHDG
jgi:hypothetical protein